MFWDEGPCLMVLIYRLWWWGKGLPGDGSELGVLSLRISWLVTSCCIRRNAFFSSFHVLFKVLSYLESAANSLNVICLSIAHHPPPLSLFLGLFLPLRLQLCLIIWLRCMRFTVYEDVFQQLSFNYMSVKTHNPCAAVWWGLTGTLGASKQHN